MGAGVGAGAGAGVGAGVGEGGVGRSNEEEDGASWARLSVIGDVLTEGKGIVRWGTRTRDNWNRMRDGGGRRKQKDERREKRTGMNLMLG